MPTSWFLTIASPAGTPSPVTTLNTPGGKISASATSSANRSSVSGVHSDGLITTVFPAASAGADLPRRHVQRVVPRGDQPGDADRLAPQDAREPLHVLAGGEPAEDPGARGEEPELVGDDRDLLGHRERVAPCRRSRDSSRPSSSPCSSTRSAICSRARLRSPGVASRPGLVERLPGGGHRSVDVGGGRLRDLGDHVAVGGADDLAGLAVRGVRPLAADVHLVGLRVAHPDLTFLRRDPEGSEGRARPKYAEKRPDAGPARRRRGGSLQASASGLTS